MRHGRLRPTDGGPSTCVRAGRNARLLRGDSHRLGRLLCRLLAFFDLEGGSARTLDVSAHEKEASGAKGKEALVTRKLRLKVADASSAELHAGMMLKTRLGTTSMPLGTCLVLQCSETRLMLGSPSRDVLFILGRDAADATAAAAMSSSAEKEFGYWDLDRRLALVKPSEKGKKK